MEENNLKAHIYVLIATFLVAGSFIATQKLADVVNPFSLTLLRFVGSVVILSPIILIRKQYRDKVISTIPRAMVISFFYALYFMTMFESLKTTTVLNTGTLYTLVPLLTAILAFFIFKEEIGIKKFIVYIVGLLGTIWVVFRADISELIAFSLNSGDYIYLVGVVSMAIYSITMKLMYRDDNPFVLVFCTLLGGAIWMGLAMIIFEKPLNWHMIDNDLVYYMAYLVIGTTIITLYLYQKTTIILGPTKVMSYIYLNPIAVAFLAWLINSSKIESIVIPGIIISCIATVILQRDKKREK